jgi:hypothetical protein
MSSAVAIAAAAASASPWLLDQVLGKPAPAPVTEPDRTTTPQTDKSLPNYWTEAYRNARAYAAIGLFGITPAKDSGLSSCYAQLRAGVLALRGELAGHAGVPRASLADAVTLCNYWLTVWRFGFRSSDGPAAFRLVDTAHGGYDATLSEGAFAGADTGADLAELAANGYHLTELGTSVCSLAILRRKLRFAVVGWLQGRTVEDWVTDAWNACADVAVDMETVGIFRDPGFDLVGRAGYWFSHPLEGLAKTGGAAAGAAADLVTGTFGGLVGDILFSTPVLVAVGAYVAWRVTR